MKNTTLVLAVSLLTTVLGSGCDSADQAVQNAGAAVNASELQHTFQQNNCASIGSLKLIGGSLRTTYAFSGAQVTKTETIFQSADCVTPAVSIAYIGTFNKKDQVSNGVYQIDFSYQNVNVTAQSDDAVKVLGDAHFCGDNAWVINQGVNLTSQARDTLCPLDTLPLANYDIYSVSNNTLVFGQGDPATSPDSRPTALDQSDTYQQQ